VYGIAMLDEHAGKLSNMQVVHETKVIWTESEAQGYDPSAQVALSLGV
jgi:hypothetical protein